MAIWNSGRRVSAYYKIELTKLESRRHRLSKRERALYSAHGTRWPKDALERFAAEEDSLRSDYQRLDDSQFVL